MNRRIGKLIITGIVAALSAISGYVAVEVAKTMKQEPKGGGQAGPVC